MTKYINIDTDECRGCGTCAELCPRVFFFDEDTMQAKILDQNFVLEQDSASDQDAAIEDEIEEAIQSCPAQCISWRYRDCGSCETCTLLCSNLFAFNENEEMAEVILQEGSLEDCLEAALEECSDDCTDRYDI